MSRMVCGCGVVWCGGEGRGGMVDVVLIYLWNEWFLGSMGGASGA